MDKGEKTGMKIFTGLYAMAESFQNMQGNIHFKSIDESERVTTLNPKQLKQRKSKRKSQKLARRKNRH